MSPDDIRHLRAARETLIARKPHDLTQHECMVLVDLINEIAMPLAPVPPTSQLSLYDRTDPRDYLP